MTISTGSTWPWPSLPKPFLVKWSRNFFKTFFCNCFVRVHKPKLKKAWDWNNGIAHTTMCSQYRLTQQRSPSLLTALSQYPAEITSHIHETMHDYLGTARIGLKAKNEINERKLTCCSGQWQFIHSEQKLSCIQDCTSSWHTDLLWYIFPILPVPAVPLLASTLVSSLPPPPPPPNWNHSH